MQGTQDGAHKQISRIQQRHRYTNTATTNTVQNIPPVTIPTLMGVPKVREQPSHRQYQRPTSDPLPNKKIQLTNNPKNSRKGSNSRKYV